jgi:hypothetical protein
VRPQPPTVVRPATIAGASVATSKAVSSLKLMSFCYRMWEFVAVAYAVAVLQLRYSHTAVQQPANPFRCCCCCCPLLSALALLSSIRYVAAHGAHRVQIHSKPRQKVQPSRPSQSNGCLCNRTDASYTSIDAAQFVLSMLSSLCCSNLPSCSHCRLHNATQAS